MRSRTVVLVCASLVLVLVGIGLAPAANQAEPAVSPTLIRPYAIGFDLGSQTAERLEADGIEFDVRELLRGIADGLTRREPRYTPAEMQDALALLEREVRARDVARRLREDPVFKALHDENLRKSRAYHDKLAKEDGVETIPGGSQRRVLETGSGRSPTRASTIIVNYRAELLSGFVFGDGRKAEFTVSELQDGTQQMLMQMQEGDHWIVALPPEIAYGAAGRDPDIGPNETILLDVELLEVRTP